MNTISVTRGHESIGTVDEVLHGTRPKPPIFLGGQ